VSRVQTDQLPDFPLDAAQLGQPIGGPRHGRRARGPETVGSKAAVGGCLNSGANARFRPRADISEPRDFAILNNSA
jgi:hypothetical protein